MCLYDTTGIKCYGSVSNNMLKKYQCKPNPTFYRAQVDLNSVMSLGLNTFFYLVIFICLKPLFNYINLWINPFRNCIIEIFRF